MKKLLFYLFLSLPVLLFAQPSKKSFSIKSGYVEYQMKGFLIGTQTMYFDDYGASYFIHTKAVSVTKEGERMQTQDIDRILLIKGDQFWLMDQKLNENYTGAVLPEQNNKKYRSMLDTEELLFDREETHYNVVCQVYKDAFGEKIFYEGVELGSEYLVQRMYYWSRAMVFEPNKSLDASLFDPMNDINYHPWPEKGACILN